MFHILKQTLADRSRLVARTKVNRLGNRVLGKAPVPVASDAPDAPAPVGGDQVRNSSNTLWTIELLTKLF